MSTNPRNRDFVKAAAHVTASAKLPSVPVVRTGDRAVDEAFRIIKENLDVRSGVAGNPFERWTTARELSDLGLLGGTALPAVTSDAVGVPVWTGRHRFELVTARALAGFLAEYLGTEPEVTADDLAHLRRSIAAIQPGATLTEVNEAIRRALAGLPAQWLRAIEESLLAIRQRLEETASQAVAASAAAAAAAAVGSVTTVTLDLGSQPVYGVSVTFDAPGVTEEDVVLMHADPSTENGALGGDELEMDGLTVAARCELAGFITARITAHPGPVCGPRNFVYFVR